MTALEMIEFAIGDKVAVANTADGVEWRGTVKYVPSPGDARRKHDLNLVDVMADGTGSVMSVERSRLRPLMPTSEQVQERLAEALADSWMGDEVDCADVAAILAPAVMAMLNGAES